MIVRQSLFGRDTERLIDGARVFLAAASAIAPQFDPAGHVLTSAFCIAIAAYGLFGTAVFVTQAGLGRPQAAKLIHAVDLLFATVMLLSPQGGSYFLILCTFCVLSCAIRWHWRAVLASGFYLLAVYVGSVYLGIISAERLTIRTAYLMLVPVATGLASVNAGFARARLIKLASWSSGRFTSGDEILRVFRHAADVLEADEILVFYQEVDHPGAVRSSYRRDTNHVETGPSDLWPEDTAHADLRSEAFLITDADRAICLTHDGMRRMSEPLPEIGVSCRRGVVLSAPFTGEFCSGRLFACGVDGWRWDQIVLIEIVASHMRARLEGRLLRDRTARVTAELERVRLSRDLHDGVLQSLTAARLQLQELQKQAPAVADAIDSVSRMLRDEQRKLREYVEKTRRNSGELVSVSRISDRIRAVAEHWRLQAKIEIDDEEAEISETLYREVYFIIGEAIANSARHGRATSIAARLSNSPERLTLALEELDAPVSDSLNGVVPRSIAERLRDLGGSLDVSRGKHGVSLKVELPIHD